MIVPKYWAEGRVSERRNRRSITVRRFGWSDISVEEAQRNADERAAQAFAKIIAGERLPRRDLKIPYNGADGIPIREEIVAEHGATVITRNSYGARCLNSPNVLFADVDFDLPRNKKLTNCLRALLVLVAIYFGIATKHFGVFIASLVMGQVIASFVSGTLQRAWILANGGIRRYLQNRVRRFVAKHPEWHLRLYETPAGYRVLALHRTFDPRDAEVQRFFAYLATDSLYARMCANQNCFRARLTAKPWRIGIRQRMKPRPGTWPVNPDRLAERRDWVDSYELAASRFAACRFIEAIGSATVNANADAVRVLHDELCGATRDLPLA